jgi:putative membrane protein
MNLLELALSLLLGGLGVLVAERLVPNMKIRGGFPSAVLIGGIYGLLKIAAQKLLILLSLPLVILSLGLFILVINAFLLWLTDKLVDRLEIRTVGSLFGATLILSIVDILFHLALHRSPLF